MKKKRAKKRASTKKVQKPKVVVQHIQRAPPEPKMEKVLVENFVALQRVLTNLAVNVDNLSNRISKLLDLFEISAKALAEKDFEFQEDTSELVDKIDSLIDQNKTLARGMALMHERMPREQFPPPQPMMPLQAPQMLPSMPLPPPLPPAQQALTQGPSSPYTKEMPPDPIPSVNSQNNPNKTPKTPSKFMQSLE